MYLADIYTILVNLAATARLACGFGEGGMPMAAIIGDYFAESTVPAPRRPSSAIWRWTAARWRGGEARRPRE
jgi:hypothetical protein